MLFCAFEGLAALGVDEDADEEDEVEDEDE